VSDQDQVQWEARVGRPAAAAAFAAAVLLLAGTFTLQSIIKDRKALEPLPDFLVSIDDKPSTMLVSQILLALSALGLIAVFYFLFRATAHRLPQFPRWVLYLVLVGPVLYAASLVIGAVDRIDVAHTFVDKTSHIKHCPAVAGQAGDDCASELLKHDVNPIAVGLGFAGQLATAFGFVMLPLRARRAGLMSQFMSILGVVAGGLMVLRLTPLIPEIVQAFWLGAVGALFLGRWPGGRGPAWETGQADPWPSSAERRGLVPAGGGGGSDSSNGAAAAQPVEPEPVPQRPSSRKRRKKR
jgi:hypothetical protein